VPYNLAGWEPAGRDAPGIVVHAQALRTALLGTAPGQASRPLAVLLLVAGALLVLVRDWRLALAGAAAAIGVLFAAALIALGAGTFVPVASAIATVLLAALGRTGFEAWRRGRRFGRRTQGDPAGRP
jgi:CHASE2 domain-containing sensor protein